MTGHLSAFWKITVLASERTEAKLRPSNYRCVVWLSTGSLYQPTPHITHVYHNIVPCYIVHNDVFIEMFQPLDVARSIAQYVACEPHRIADMNSLIVRTRRDDGNIVISNYTHRHSKVSNVCLYIVLYHITYQSAQIWPVCVTRGSQSFTCHPHTNHTCLYTHTYVEQSAWTASATGHHLRTVQTIVENVYVWLVGPGRGALCLNVKHIK